MNDLAVIILGLLSTAVTLAGYVFGFGLTVHSWGALIGGIFMGAVIGVVAKALKKG